MGRCCQRLVADSEYIEAATATNSGFDVIDGENEEATPQAYFGQESSDGLDSLPRLSTNFDIDLCTHFFSLQMLVNPTAFMI